MPFLDGRLIYHSTGLNGNMLKYAEAASRTGDVYGNRDTGPGTESELFGQPSPWGIGAREQLPRRKLTDHVLHTGRSGHGGSRLAWTKIA